MSNNFVRISGWANNLAQKAAQMSFSQIVMVQFSANVSSIVIAILPALSSPPNPSNGVITPSPALATASRFASNNHDS